MSDDLTKKLPQSDNLLDLILTAVQNLEKAMQSSLDNLVTWVGSMDSRVRLLERTVEERLHDTRPIWEKVLADIGLLGEGQTRLEESLRTMAGEIKKSLRDIDRRQSALNDSILKIQGDYHDLDERVNELEIMCNPQNSQT
ncbi:MAG TPA: hypothetical protein VFI24_26220 [Pyrinomonadaceae bacterium]|nr:hypothetical protein [Pyrinomonadaceae bacterium]